MASPKIGISDEHRKTMVGKVVSDKMAKTVVVEVTHTRKHPLYGKTINIVRKFKAHNEDPLAKRGDVVKLIESRPLSHDKRWRVAEIVQKGDVVEAIREKELESLMEKEKAEREAQKAAQAQRAAERLKALAGDSDESEDEDEEE